MEEATLRTKDGCHQDWAWGSTTKSPQHQGLLLPAVFCKAHLLIEPGVVHKLGEVWTYGVTRVLWVVFTRLM